MGWSSSCWGRSPVVSTVRRVDTGPEPELAAAEVAGPAVPLEPLTTITFCLGLETCWALERAASSSSCRGTGVRAWIMCRFSKDPSPSHEICIIVSPVSDRDGIS